MYKVFYVTSARNNLKQTKTPRKYLKWKADETAHDAYTPARIARWQDEKHS